MFLSDNTQSPVVSILSSANHVKFVDFSVKTNVDMNAKIDDK